MCVRSSNNMSKDPLFLERSPPRRSLSLPQSPPASSALSLCSPQPSSINSTFCSPFSYGDIIFSALICFPQHKVIPSSLLIPLMGCFLTWTRRSPLLPAHPSLTLSLVLLGPPAAGPVCIGHQMAPTTFLEWIYITCHSGSGSLP